MLKKEVSNRFCQACARLRGSEARRTVALSSACRQSPHCKQRHSPEPDSCTNSGRKKKKLISQRCHEVRSHSSWSDRVCFQLPQPQLYSYQTPRSILAANFAGEQGEAASDGQLHLFSWLSLWRRTLLSQTRREKRTSGQEEGTVVRSAS